MIYFSILDPLGVDGLDFFIGGFVVAAFDPTVGREYDLLIVGLFTDNTGLTTDWPVFFINLGALNGALGRLFIITRKDASVDVCFGWLVSWSDFFLIFRLARSSSYRNVF